MDKFKVLLFNVERSEKYYTDKLRSLEGFEEGKVDLEFTLLKNTEAPTFVGAAIMAREMVSKYDIIIVDSLYVHKATTSGIYNSIIITAIINELSYYNDKNNKNRKYDKALLYHMNYLVDPEQEEFRDSLMKAVSIDTEINSHTNLQGDFSLDDIIYSEE